MTSLCSALLTVPHPGGGWLDADGVCRDCGWTTQPKEEETVGRTITYAGGDARAYRIVTGADDRLAHEFTTAAGPNASADEVAEANLADWSDHRAGEFLLFRGTLLMAVAEHGCVRSYRPDDARLVRA